MPCQFPKASNGVVIPCGEAAKAWAASVGVPVGTPRKQADSVKPLSLGGVGGSGVGNGSGNGDLNTEDIDIESDLQEAEMRPHGRPLPKGYIDLNSREYREKRQILASSHTTPNVSDSGHIGGLTLGKKNGNGNGSSGVLGGLFAGVKEDLDSSKEREDAMTKENSGQAGQAGTAVAEAPATKGKKTENKPKIAPNAIWGFNLEGKPWSIPILGICGGPGTGKTGVAVTIDPKRTLVYDGEGSSLSYKDSLGFERIDLQAELGAKAANLKPIDTFIWWAKDIGFPLAGGTPEAGRLATGKYSVAVLDPSYIIEEGAKDWVMANPQFFGKTHAQFAAKNGAMMWGELGSLWRRIITYLQTRVQTLVAVNHLTDIWDGDKRTGRQKAKGRHAVLVEMASLYLRLERADNQDVPTAYIYEKKMRLCHFEHNAETGEIVMRPALPPRISNCTPARIRSILVNPPDYSKLGKDQRVEQHVMTDEEKLRIEAGIAENRRIEAERRAEIASAAIAMRGGSVSGVVGAVPANATGTVAATVSATPAATATPANVATATTANAATQATTAATVEEAPFDTQSIQPAAIDDSQKAEIARLKGLLNPPKEKWVAVLKKEYQVDSALLLTHAQADDLIIKLRKTEETRRMKADEEAMVKRMAESGVQPGAANAPEAAANAGNSPVDGWVNGQQ